jgi:hypothetical protein
MRRGAPPAHVACSQEWQVFWPENWLLVGEKLMCPESDRQCDAFSGCDFEIDAGEAAVGIK